MPPSGHVYVDNKKLLVFDEQGVQPETITSSLKQHPKAKAAVAFDSSFFWIPIDEAKAVDAQQRFLLEAVLDIIEGYLLSNTEVACPYHMHPSSPTPSSTPSTRCKPTSSSTSRRFPKRRLDARPQSAQAPRAVYGTASPWRTPIPTGHFQGASSRMVRQATTSPGTKARVVHVATLRPAQRRSRVELLGREAGYEPIVDIRGIKINATTREGGPMSKIIKQLTDAGPHPEVTRSPTSKRRPPSLRAVVALQEGNFGSMAYYSNSQGFEASPMAAGPAFRAEEERISGTPTKEKSEYSDKNTECFW
ncbi:Uu.00g040930.m01.CDS01 [Anthostomella pinea]|uniref:Uu.00g040930.m01.CDS01 n=1 Tax=Anthostomella pinea TaxID=933095 RepID=A0AAI8YDZ0_9PEZI|nr:Uu.00g040930.m01.CDS01 [Anthostomella pinea]